MRNLIVLLVLLFLSISAYAEVSPIKTSSDDLSLNFKDSIPAKEIPAIRKRVNHYIKGLKARRDAGYVPDLNMGLDEYAAFTQWGLNERSIVPDKGFLGECRSKSAVNENEIVCYLFWPKKFSKKNKVSQHYVNYVEEVSSNFANSMTRNGGSYSFTYISYLNIGDMFVPIYEVIFDKETNKLKKTENKNFQQSEASEKDKTPIKINSSSKSPVKDNVNAINLDKGEIAEEMKEYLNSKPFKAHFEKSLTSFFNSSDNFKNIPVHTYYAECHKDIIINPTISCTMYFPDKWGYNLPEKYESFMYMMTSEVAHTFSKKYKTDFTIFGYYGGLKIWNTWYDYYTDQFGRW